MISLFELAAYFIYNPAEKIISFIMNGFKLCEHSWIPTGFHFIRCEKCKIMLYDPQLYALVYHNECLYRISENTITLEQMNIIIHQYKKENPHILLVKPDQLTVHEN